VGRRNKVNGTSKGQEQAMAALVTTKSARERLEKLTGDFNGTDGSADDDGAAEVAEGSVLMMGEGRSRAFALGSCYDGGKGRWRLVAMVLLVHGCTVCTTVRDPGRHKDGTSHGSRFLMSSPNDYRHDNLHW
jgi:hypothetical protein